MLQWFARKPKEAQEKDNEKGFTLIELLVVVIIIGILAAIAIPVYLNQVNKSKDATAEAQLRNAATAQQSYYTTRSSHTYGKTVTDLTGEGFRDSTEAPLTVVSASPTAYCMSAPGGTGSWYMSSASGTPSTTACT